MSLKSNLIPCFYDRSAAPEMMLQDTKFFPGHPNNIGQPFNNSFSRKDIFNQRKQREFIPEAKKDDSYWDRRRRNNEAAKRSREKRRLNDMLLETRVIELAKDNHILKCQLNAVFEKYGIKGENLVTMEQVMSTMPSNDHILSVTKKRLGPMPGMREASPSPSPIPFTNLRLPLSLNNNTGGHNNNNNSGSVDLNRSCSPERETSPSPAASYHSGSPLPTPAPHHYHAPLPHPPHTNLATPTYNDIRNFAESGHMYRQRPGARYAGIQDAEDGDSEKDSGLALNLSTDRAGSDGSRDEMSGRSSASGSPPVTSSNICADGASSGDESGYPRSPVSSGSGDAVGVAGAGAGLPHKLRFKSVVGEKEAVSSLLSLHQMAMIKREPVDHINHWMETAGAGVGGVGGVGGPHAGLLASLLPHAAAAGSHFKSIEKEREVRQQQETDTAEPQQKRLKLGGLGLAQHNINDEVARLSSEVATLKHLLVNRMKDEEDEDREDN